MSNSRSDDEPRDFEDLHESKKHDAKKKQQRSQDIQEHHRLAAASVFEILRREGEGELARGLPALWWSGIAAGLSIGFSVLSEAYLAAHLPDTPWKPLVDNLGYSVGFVIVIMARQQLFTENTLTAVLPAIARGTPFWFLVLLRLWVIVLAANLVGCLIFSAFIAYGGVLSSEVETAVRDISTHLMSFPPDQMFLRGILAGWLIAALVWMLPSAEGNEFLVIVLVTYLIALGDFTHVIAGSAEVFYLMWLGALDLQQVVLGFLLPTLLGNVFGGTILFGVLSYAQVREEIPEAGDE